MAIAIDGSTPIRFTGTPANGANITSASFTAPANSVLVCCVNADTNGSAADITISVSDSGGLTWSNRVEMDPGTAGAEAGHASIWRAVQTSSASRTVSVQRTAGNGSTNRISAKVYVVTGADTSTPDGNTGSGHSTTNDITPNVYTSSVNNSRGFGCATDWNELGTPTSTDTEDGDDYPGAISVVSLFKAADTATSGTTVTMDFDAAGTAAAAWNWVAYELKPAAGGGSQTVTCTGIASAQAFGTASVQLNINATGIASTEAFGTASVQLNVNATGIASQEAFGTASVQLNINATGIVSAEAFGTAVVTQIQSVRPTGIASREAFGNVVVVREGAVAAKSQRRILLHHSDGFLI